jgi:hypothetical protein
LAGALSSGATAHAQEVQGRAADSDSPLIAQGVTEYNAGRFAEARALFLRAHADQPSARTLRGIGMASFELREYVAAIRALREALEHESRPLTEAQRAHVTELIERSQVFVGRFEPRLTPEDASLLVDGRPAELVDGAVLLDIGTHELRVERADHAPWSRAIAVEGGERQELVVALEAVERGAVEPAPPPEPPAPSPPTVEPAPAPREQTRSLVGPIVLLSGGVALIAGGLVTGAVAGSRASELEACARRVCPSTLAETRDEARTLALVADVLWIAGAVAVVGGAALWLFGSDPDVDDDPVAFVGCGPAGCRAAVRVALP